MKMNGVNTRTSGMAEFPKLDSALRRSCEYSCIRVAESDTIDSPRCVTTHLEVEDLVDLRLVLFLGECKVGVQGF